MNIYLALYLLGLLVVYFKIRKDCRKDNDWNYRNLFLAIGVGIINPLVIFVFIVIKLEKSNFWNKKLPKWF